MISIRFRLAGLLALSLLPALGQAPSGFRTNQDPASGLQFYWPTPYKEIPLEPTEAVFRAKYVRKRVPDVMEKKRFRFKPQIQIFLFREQGTSRTLSPGEKATKADEPEIPTSFREMMEARSAVKNLDELLKRRLAQWNHERYKGKRDQLALKHKQGRTKLVGHLSWKRQGGWVMGAVGLTGEPHLKKMRSDVVRIAKSLKLRSASERERGDSALERKLERLYGKGKYRAGEHRKRVRRGLAKGWKAVDTENYILVHHTKNTKLINRIAKDIEAMRVLYSSLFPAVKEIDAVNVVRICRNRGEYLAYGGSPSSGGFWHPGNEELVFYDYAQSSLDGQKTGGRKTGNKDSLLVLYHEAFHQYVFYAVGEITPHYWFNEGYGDYFSGAIIRGKKVSEVGPSWWRIHRAKDHAELGKGRVPLHDLLHAERPQYYDPRRAGDFYAAGWSFVFFMRESDAVKKNPKWSGLLELYFEELKKAYAKEIEALGEKAALPAKQAAGKKARDHALAVMLKDVDLTELEEAWEKYIKRVRDPWPHLRKRK